MKGARYSPVDWPAGMLAVITAFGVAAVTLLPMYRYLREDSPRAGPGRGLGYAAIWSLHAEEALTLFIPDSPEPTPNQRRTGERTRSSTIPNTAGARWYSSWELRPWLASRATGAVGASEQSLRVTLLYALGAGTPVLRLALFRRSGIEELRGRRAGQLPGYGLR